MDKRNSNQSECVDCQQSHSQFFKCPHYKGNKRRAEKICQKLAQKVVKFEEEKLDFKFKEEIDVLPFQPKHVFTINGIVTKKEGKKKNPVWKKILKELDSYRGLTWTDIGVQQALFIQFGKDGVIQNKNLFIEKLNQLAKWSSSKTIRNNKVVGDLKHITNQTRINEGRDVFQELDQMTGDIVDLETKIQNAKYSEDYNQEQLTKLQKNIERVNERVTQTKNSNHDRHVEVIAQINDHKVKTIKVEDDLNNIKDIDIFNLKLKYKLMEDNMSALCRKINEMSEKLESGQVTIDKMKLKNDILHLQVKDLQAKNEKQSKQLSRLKSHIETFVDDVVESALLN